MKESAEPGKAPQSVFTTCTRCRIEVRTSELWAHTAHAHNIDLDAKAPKGRGKGRDRGQR